MSDLPLLAKLVLGLVLLITGIRRYDRYTFSKRKWVSTIGYFRSSSFDTLVERDLSDPTSSTIRDNLVIAYRLADGTLRAGAPRRGKLAANLTKKIGEEMPVKYDPKHPDVFEIEATGLLATLRTWMPRLMMISGTIMLLWWFFAAAAKHL